MAREGFYNENEFRDYPFLTRTEPLALTYDGPGPLADLPEEAIVDFGAIMEVDSEFDDAEGDYVYLHSITRDGTTLIYRFRTTAAAAAAEELVFIRDTTTDGEWASEWVEATRISDSSGSVDSVGDPCLDVPKWRGFMVSGRFEQLVTALADQETRTYGQGLWRIEPARLQSLVKTYLRSISLANTPRRIVTLPDGCEVIEQPTTPIVHARCLQGPLAFREGYNCLIRQEDRNNAIIISGSKGNGAGEPCEEVPRYAGEASPDGGQFLSGGPTCGQVLKTLNGVGGRNIVLRSGPGFTVALHPTDPNTLVIDRDLGGFAACGDEDSSSLSSMGDEE